MTIPGPRDWLFSAKTFAAAMIAFYIALAFNLDRPYWCIATVYVVSQPLAGAMRAKGVYRICGTIVGAAVSIVLVPNLVDAPVLLTAALCLWLGLCLYLALYDRTPRSYLFMLAGYTASIIGFPSVDQPGEIFVTAWARVEEISLGIACATLIGSIVLPNPVAPILDTCMANYFAAARRWTLAAVAGANDSADAQTDRRIMAGAPAEFVTLTTHLAHDTSKQFAVRKPVALLGARLSYLLVVVSSLAVYLAALRRAQGLTRELDVLLGQVTDFLCSGPQTPPEVAQRLRSDLSAEASANAATRGWTGFLRALLAARLIELVDVVQDIRALRLRVESGDPHVPQLALRPGTGPDATRYHDHAMALLSAVTAMLALALLCAFWITTEWPEGSIAAMMAAILCSFFAGQDDPVRPMIDFLVDIVVGFFLSAIYLFVLLPQAVDFTTLALALAPFYLLLGAFPRTRSLALNGTMMMTLTAAYDADFASFINTSLASGTGIAVAAVVTALVRSVGADVSARRLKEACRSDLARAAAGQGTIRRPTLAALLLDRITALAPRLAGPDTDRRLQNAFRDLNAGLAIVDIRRERDGLPPAAGERLSQTLSLLDAYFRSSRPDDATLLANFDRTVLALGEAGTATGPGLAMDLLAIRLNLFPDAPIPGVAGGDRETVS